jgi:hypothetical protein
VTAAITAPTPLAPAVDPAVTPTTDRFDLERAATAIYLQLADQLSGGSRRQRRAR